MATETPNVNWEIASTGVETVGNDANRFDTWRQSGTLGPTPEAPSSGPPETGGDIPHQGT